MAEAFGRDVWESPLEWTAVCEMLWSSPVPGVEATTLVKLQQAFRRAAQTMSRHSSIPRAESGVAGRAAVVKAADRLLRANAVAPRERADALAVLEPAPAPAPAEVGWIRLSL